VGNKRHENVVQRIEAADKKQAEGGEKTGKFEARDADDQDFFERFGADEKSTE
jgi:hypothetical protein